MKFSKDPNSWSTENLRGITNIDGAAIGRDTLAMAREGVGFNYINLPLKSDAATRLSLGYVQPVMNGSFCSPYQ